MATKKKPSPAQLAARKLFAQRAKAGTLSRRPAKKSAPKKRAVRKTTRKVNPVAAKPAKPAYKYTMKINGKVMAGAHSEKDAKGISQWLADLYKTPVEIHVA